MDSRLGFGCMRLPTLASGDSAALDSAAINKMVDAFMEHGFCYFDTAYLYHDRRSEIAVREALVKRYPRERFALATKLPLHICDDAESMCRIFAEQLEKCGVDYFDYYLLHGMTRQKYDKANELGAFAFCMDMKRQGKIRRFGMSFHDSPELLEEILTVHPELEFVQLQVNYIDLENPGVRARECCETARRHNVPIIVMEPCKGGRLASLPEPAERMMKAFAPDRSIASWAIRFAASLDGVMMVLSGMSNMEQMLDNISSFSDFEPLCDEEYRIIEKVAKILAEISSIPCTRCRYCEDSCPQNIAISEYFSLYNNTASEDHGKVTAQSRKYMELTKSRGAAGSCIGCGLCESICPQHIRIRDRLRDVVNAYGK